VLAVVIGIAGVDPVAAQLEYNMPRGVTAVSENVYQLHMLMFAICCVLAVVVFGVMIYSIIRFRHSRGAVPATFHESTMVEIAWTVVPFAILISIAIPASSVSPRSDKSISCVSMMS
jgi:cytochrome c oxidase subunit 2